MRSLGSAGRLHVADQRLNVGGERGNGSAGCGYVRPVGFAFAALTLVFSVAKEELTASICEENWSLASVLTCSMSDWMFATPNASSLTASGEVGSIFLMLSTDVSRASTEPQAAGLSLPHPTRVAPSKRVAAAAPASLMN
jgi:hypothetical protein